MLKLYKKYHLEKDYTSIDLFREIKKKFNPKRVLYPGCYVHITPSLIFDDVTYIDSFQGTDKFFKSDEVGDYINKNKKYEEKAIFKFYNQDYSKSLQLKINSFDLIISQYGGFVGQSVKKYLKKGGILVCNNSHGDATLASLDKDYELIAVYTRKSDKKFTISTKNIDTYLIPKKKFTKKQIKETMKGVAYTKSPSGYIFRKK